MYVVSGATGNVGRHLVAELAAAGAPVRALTRNPGASVFPAGVEAARTSDLPLAGAEGLFLNPAAFWDGTEEVLRRAVDEGVRRVVLLSSESVSNQLAGNAIAEHHARLERAVEATGLRWVHLRPGAFAANALNWAGMLAEGDTVYGPYADSRTAPIHEADIAAVAARALLSGEHDGTTPELSGPESLSFTDQARILGAALDRPLRYEELPPEQARAAMEHNGIPGPIADALLQYWEATVGKDVPVSGEVERITGRAPRSFAQWAEENAGKFR